MAIKAVVTYSGHYYKSLDSRTRTTTSTRFDFSQKIDTQECFIVLFVFTTNFSSVIFIEGV